MIKEITLPEVSENIDKGEVIKILVKEGDKIEVDQPLVELETDKAMFEVPSTEAGVVKEIKVKEGGSLDVGGVILTVETDGKEEGDEKEKSEKETGKKAEVSEKEKKKPEEESKDKESKKEKPGKEEEESEDGEKKADEEEKKKDEEGKKDEAEPAGDSKRTKVDEEKEPEDTPDSEKEKNQKKIPAPASPSVRRLARELGVEIDNVQGSGSSGRISEEDVKKHVKDLMEGTAPGTGAAAAQKALPDFSKWGDVEVAKMSKVRQITAETLSYAWTTIPHVTHFDRADITLMESFRKKYGKKIESEGGQLTITSILVKIAAAALKEFPRFNSSIDVSRKEIIYKKYFNIGIAVDTDRGLLVPVIKNVEKKSLTKLSKELTELAEKARNKKITLDEMEGGTFTITNLGGIGGTNFTPIVYAPQVAILAVSRANMEAVYIDGEFKPRLMAPLALSYDHRIIDGADAARFLRWICEALENPFLIQL